MTSRMLSDSTAAALPSTESIAGVRIHRVWTTQFGRNHLKGRSVDYLSFYLASFLQLIRFIKQGDTLIAKTDPPLISVICMMVARVKGARLVNWIQDLFPELAEVLGIRFANGRVGRALRAIRDHSLRFADLNVAIGDRMADRLRSMGLEEDKIVKIQNWTDETQIVPIKHAENHLRQQWGIDGQFVVGYSGNMGRAHEFKTILDAAELLKDDGRISFLFIGDGKHRDYLEREAIARGLTSICFQPYQPRDVLPYSLSVTDLHLVSLRPEMEGLVVPSKFYGIAAAGRPTLFIGHPEGEIASLLDAYQCGVTVEQGDAESLAASIRHLKDRPDALESMGARARQACIASLSRRQARASWIRELIQEDEEETPAYVSTH